MYVVQYILFFKTDCSTVANPNPNTLVLFYFFYLTLCADKQASKTEEEKNTAETQFKAVNEAYEVLSCPEKKQR